VNRFSVEILPAAEAAFREAFFWYFERSPLAATVIAVAHQRRLPGYWSDRRARGGTADA
jgi:hypothetical protein